MNNKTVSVVIATKDRAEALDTISLPSLVAQNCNDFEVIVWDATEDDSSEKICEKYFESFKLKNIELRYFKAPRSGLCSQRNDSVKKTNGKYIFFIDDDSKISINGIIVLIKAFENNPDRMGIGLPVDYTSAESIIKTNPYIHILRFLRKTITFPMMYIKRKLHENRQYIVSFSGGIIYPKICIGGDAEWLFGCNMAYRKQVFEDNLKFDERLQAFGGYSSGEDVDFSHRIMLFYKMPLLITNDGLVQHLPFNNGRIADKDKKYATRYYNNFIKRENFGLSKTKNKLYLYYSFLKITLHTLIKLKFSELKNNANGFKMVCKQIESS